MYKVILTKTGQNPVAIVEKTWDDTCRAIQRATDCAFDNGVLKNTVLKSRPGDSLYGVNTKIVFEVTPSTRLLVVTVTVREQEKAFDTPTYSSMSFSVSSPESLNVLLDSAVAGFCDIPFKMRELTEEQKNNLRFGTESTSGEAVVITDEPTGDELSISSRWVEN